EPGQRRGRARAVMLDDLGGGQAAESTAGRQVAAAAIAVKKAGGILVAGAGGVDHAVDRRGVDDMHLPAAEDERAPGAAGEGRDQAAAARSLQRRIEVVDLPERADLRLIGEQDVDMAVDQGQELVT